MATACKLYSHKKKSKMSVKLSHSSRGSKQTHISPPENTAEEVKSGRRKKKPPLVPNKDPHCVPVLEEMYLVTFH